MSCLALFVAAALYEGLKLGREKLIAYELKQKAKLGGGDIENKPSIRLVVLFALIKILLIAVVDLNLAINNQEKF